MISFLLLNLSGFVLVSLAMTLIWYGGLKIKKAGIVDVFWSLLVLLLALYFTLMNQARGEKMGLLIVLTTIWAMRLAAHIFYRNKKLGRDDTRYQALKEKWGKAAPQKMWKFYIQQGAGALLFAWPALFVSLSHSVQLGIFEWVGSAVVGVAIFGETCADFQLEQFKSNLQNKGKVCRVGLWNVSRHPNYFFEWLVWVGMAIYASGTSWGWISMICPAGMYYLLNHVTGIPITERESVKSRGPAYETYQQEVNAFFPGSKKRPT